MATKIKAGKELARVLKDAAEIKQIIADSNHLIEKYADLKPAFAPEVAVACRITVKAALMDMTLALETMMLNGCAVALKGVDENVSESDTESEAEG